MDTPESELEKMAALGRVTRALIHDFNNSLASIMGHADFLIADLPPQSEQHLFAENIRKAALQLQDSLNQIKNFSADSSHLPPVPPVPPVSPIPQSILLVEDREMVLKTIKTMLEREHHRVETANDGFAALDMIRENPRKYDILITDYSMPEWNGKNLLDEIRQDFKNLPVIIMSGDLQSLDDLRNDPSNQNIFVLPKPITPHDLSVAILSMQRRPK
ncbi:MAG TPA: hypothetical protein DCM27_00230 [Rhodospirillaceae bacterium]|nr:hypothetical protein [Rhodospirillaceae bacterium]